MFKMLKTKHLEFNRSFAIDYKYLWLTFKFMTNNICEMTK